MTDMTYYEVLGLDAIATASELRTAYYRLPRAHHPDKNAEG